MVERNAHARNQRKVGNPVTGASFKRRKEVCRNFIEVSSSLLPDTSTDAEEKRVVLLQLISRRICGSHLEFIANS